MSRDITPTLSLGEIAARWPELIPTMEDLHLDYCCHGADTITQAAERIHVSPWLIATRLSTAPDPAPTDAAEIDWTRRTMTELADHIEQTHHAFVRRAVERLAALVERCVAAHADERPHYPELETVIKELSDDLLEHMVREERVLFPWIRRLERPTEIQGGPPWSVRRPIDCMIHDHDRAGEAFETIRRLTSDLAVPDDACTTERELLTLLAALERDTHLHIHKENNMLFPKAIDAERRREDGLGRSAVRARFRPAFTLVEVLVVIAIVAMLVSVLLPAIGKARSAGRSVACLSNSRSIAIAMSMYASDDDDNFFPTARMPGMAMGGNPAAPIQMSWLYLLAPYLEVEHPLPDDPSAEEVQGFVEAMHVCHCPDDHSQNWHSMMMPRLASYGINAYLTPNHPPHWGVKSFQIRSPSECVLCAELAEEMAMDHFMPMYWGEPPAVENAMIQSRQWDTSTRLPRTIQHSRHNGQQANYVFTDGHAAAHTFDHTWHQATGQAPSVDWYDPRR